MVLLHPPLGGLGANFQPTNQTKPKTTKTTNNNINKNNTIMKNYVQPETTMQDICMLNAIMLGSQGQWPIKPLEEDVEPN